MKKAFLISFVFLLYACGGAKYNYLFDTGRQLDFSEGKWILNRTQSNSKIFDAKLYSNSLRDFKKILGDSLIEMSDLRNTKLVSPKIKFDLSYSDLKELKRFTNCDYLINITGNVISDGAGTLTFPDEIEKSSNRASVSIYIYDLNAATLVSSSQFYGNTKVQNPVFEDDTNLPTINPSSHMIMLKGAEKLIKKYGKNQLK